MHSAKVLLLLVVVICTGIAGYVEAGCPTGDLDGNCRVDLADLLVLSEHWLSTADTSADLNSDGDVNSIDLSILAANWGRSGIPLVINEVLASNTKTNADPQGQFDDWIELYNAGDMPIDVGGMYLTDDLAVPTKWQIPSGNPSLTTVNSKGYLLIWADNDVGQSGLHANFRIDAAGDEIALFDKDGSTLIDSISFGDQMTDVSYGRYPDAADNWALMAYPTPGGMNIMIYEGFVAKPQFSHERGFYTQPFSVTLTTQTDEAIIYYTVDGSAPYDSKLGVPKGAAYVGPIPITKTTCLRAVAYKLNWQPSAVVTHTYLFVSDVKTQSPSGQAPGPGWPTGSVNGQMIDYGMDPDVVNNPLYKDLIDDALLAIPTISLVTDLANLFSASTGIYVHASSQGRSWERPVSVELINPDGSDGFQIDAGLRIRGGYSRSGSNPKHAFRLFFRPDYGASKLRFALFGDEGVDEFECVDLRCSQNYSWSFEGGGSPHDTFVREVFSRDTQRDMGRPYTRSRYYHLYIDGHYWGLYQTQERSEASYAESYFGGDKEDYDVVKSRAGNGGYDIEATDGTLDAWRRLWDSLHTTLSDQTYYRLQGLNTDGTPNPAYEKLLDVDNLIDYMLCTYYVGDPDGPVSAWARVANNFYGIYNRNNPDGFKFFRHDAEHSLWDLQESRLFASTTLAVGNQFNQSNPLWVHTHLIVHPEYKMRFADRVYKFFFNDGVLTPGQCTSRFMNRANEINLAIIAESARWGDAKRSTPRTRDADWLPDINRMITNYFPYRTDVVLNQFKSRGWFPNVDAPTFNQNGGYVPSGFNLQISAPTGKIYYTLIPRGAGSLDGSDPRLPEHASGGSTTTLVPENAPKRVLVPTAAVSDAWKGGQTFDDSLWTAGTGGVGYETSTGYEAYFTINVREQMYNKNATCYIRIPFTLSSVQLAATKKLTLRMRYDDGFVAYINGTEVQRNLFTGTPSWNSQADSTHDDSAAVIFEDFDISNYVGLLRQGENILAIHGLNRPASSSDLLISVELVGVDTSSSGGGVSPAAIEYTEPITLAKSTQVKARVLSGATWSALNEAVFAVGPVAESLRITEIMYHPQDTGNPNDPNTEFIELKNIGTQTINLNLARFTKGIDFSFGDVELAPDTYILVVKDVNAFNEKYGYPPLAEIAGTYTRSLDNAGERIQLQDAAGKLIHDFKYSDGWYDITDGVGFSLTVKDPANLAAEPNALDDKSKWRPSASIGGSPGYDDTGIVPELGDIVINEILAHSHAAGADWIELHNTTNTTINIGNWFLSDDQANLTKYQIKEGTSIPAYGYIVFYENEHFNNPNDPGCNVPFALSENGETLYLHSGTSAGVLTGYSEQENFDASETGVSMGRYKKSTGAYNFVALQTPTPGADNSYPKVGPVVINEIMYHPDTVEDAEYVELLNISSYSVTLYDEVVGEPWRFVDDPDNPGVDFRFPTDSPVEIEAGEYLLLVKDLTLFSSKFTVPQGVKVFQWGSGRLDNGGEKLQISKPGDVDLEGVQHWIRVDRVVYSDGAHPDVEPNSVDPWPKDADGLGKSLSRKYPHYYGNDPNNWQASVPSPGQANP